MLQAVIITGPMGLSLHTPLQWKRMQFFCVMSQTETMKRYNECANTIEGKFASDECTILRSICSIIQSPNNENY